mgnify:CR=1 FL=1
MINNVFLLGRIAHDLSYTVDENDLERCTFKIAVNSYNNLTNYPTVTVFGKDAKNLVNYNSKGDLILSLIHISEPTVILVQNVEEKIMASINTMKTLSHKILNIYLLEIMIQMTKKIVIIV